MCVSGPEQHMYMCAAPLLNLCSYTCAYWSSGSTGSTEIFPSIPNIPPLLWHTYCAHTPTPLSPLPLQGHLLTSAERRKACHRRSKTLTISEFTSAQAQGSARSDRPPNSLVIKDKDTEEGEGERKRDWGGKNKGGRKGAWLSPFRQSCWNVLRWHKLLHTVCALSCEATCAVSTVKVLFIVAYVSVWL